MCQVVPHASSNARQEPGPERGRFGVTADVDRSFGRICQGLGEYGVLALLILMLITVGMFLDGVSIFLIFVPLLWPIVQYYKWDPVWFGVMFLICMQLGLLLPPHGLLLMTMRGVAPPSVTMAHIFVAVVPYVVMSLILLAAVFWIPAIATWLPKLIG